MIEETARVVDEDGEFLLVQANRKSVCGGCSVKAGCGTSVLSRLMGIRVTQLRVRNTVNATIGDELVIGLREDALLKGSFLVYSLPLLVMLVCAVLASAYGPAIGVTEAGVVLISIAGFFTGVIASRSIISLSSARHSFEPVILRKNSGRATIRAF